MTDWKQYSEHYIKRLKGPESESAYHALIDADDLIIPVLVDAFRIEQDPAIRSELVEIIWQHRNPNIIEFLSEALNDPNPEVWKNALDGLVALACPKATDVLHSAQARVFPNQKQTEEFQRWLKEAIEQAEERMKIDHCDHKTDRSPYRKSRCSFDKIRDILNKWDPAGVSDLDPHQYDMYVSGIMTLLDQTHDVTIVANALSVLAKQMGGDSHFEHDRTIAEELIQRWEIASSTRDE